MGEGEFRLQGGQSLEHRCKGLDLGIGREVWIMGLRLGREEEFRLGMGIDPGMPTDILPAQGLQAFACQRTRRGSAFDAPAGTGIQVPNLALVQLETQQAVSQEAAKGRHGDLFGSGTGQHQDRTAAQVVLDQAALPLHLGQGVGTDTGVHVDSEDHFVLRVLMVEATGDGLGQGRVHARSGEVLLATVAVPRVSMMGVLRRDHDVGLRVGGHPGLPGHVVGGYLLEEATLLRPIDGDAFIVQPEAVRLRLLSSSAVDHGERGVVHAHRAELGRLTIDLGHKGGTRLAAFTGTEEDRLIGDPVVDHVVVVGDPKRIGTTLAGVFETHHVVVRPHVTGLIDRDKLGTVPAGDQFADMLRDLKICGDRRVVGRQAGGRDLAAAQA